MECEQGNGAMHLIFPRLFLPFFSFDERVASQSYHAFAVSLHYRPGEWAVLFLWISLFLYMDSCMHGCVSLCVCVCVVLFIG